MGPAAGFSEEVDDEGDDLETVALRGISSLERLRDRIDTAAMELRRLRDENRALAERIRELEARPEVDPGETVLTFDRDPEVLKRKIAGFIDALDAYLDREGKTS